MSTQQPTPTIDWDKLLPAPSQPGKVDWDAVLAPPKPMAAPVPTTGELSPMPGQPGAPEWDRAKGLPPPQAPGQPPTGEDVANYAELMGREAVKNVATPTEDLLTGMSRFLHDTYLGTARTIDDIARRNVWGMDLGLERAAKGIFGEEAPTETFKRFLPETEQPRMQDAAKKIEAYAPAIGFVRKMAGAAEHAIGYMAPGGAPGRLIGGVSKLAAKAMPGAVPAAQQAVGMGAGFGAETMLRTGDPIESAKAAAAGSIFPLFGAASHYLDNKLLAAGISQRAAGALSKGLEGIGITPVLDPELVPRAISIVARSRTLQDELQQALTRGDESAAERLNAEAKALDAEWEGMLATVAGNVGAFGAMGAIQARRQAPDFMAKRAREAGGPAIPGEIAEAFDRQGFAIEARPEGQGTRISRPGFDFTVRPGKEGGLEVIEGDRVLTGEAALQRMADLHRLSRGVALASLDLEGYAGVERTGTPGVYYADVPGFQGYLSLLPSGELMGTLGHRGKPPHPTEGWQPVDPEIITARPSQYPPPLGPQEGALLKAWGERMGAADAESQALWSEIATKAQTLPVERRTELVQALAAPEVQKAAMEQPGWTVDAIADALVADNLAALPGKVGAFGAEPPKVVPRGTEVVKPGEAQPTQQQEAAQPAEAVAAAGGISPQRGKQAMEIGKQAASLARDYPIEFHSEPLIERLERKGGPQAKEAAGMLRRIVDRQKAIRGEMSAEVDKALQETGRPGEATAWLNTLATDPTGRFGITETRLAVESKEPPTGWKTAKEPEGAASKVQSVVAANLKAGVLAEEAIPDFVATGKMQRLSTIELLDAIQQPRGSVGRDLAAEAHAAVNPQIDPNPNVRVEKVQALFDKTKALMDAGDWTAVERHIGQEYTRVFEQVPSAVKDPIFGWRYLYHDRAFDYVRTMSERVSHRVSVLESLSKDEIGKLAENLKSEVRSGEKGVVDDALRALHGLPPQGAVDPFGRAGRAAYAINRVMADVFRPIALSTSLLPNLPETVFGNVPRTLGFTEYFEAWGKVFGDKAMVDFLEHQGAWNKAIYDWSLDPQQPVWSTLRRFRQIVTMGSGNQFINELQEKLAAATAQVVAKKMQAGNIKGILPGRPRRLARLLEDAGFTRAEATDMVAGKAEPEVYDRFVRGAAAWLTGGNKALAESSRLQSSRLWSSIFPFQSFPVTQARLIVKPLARLVRSVKAGDWAEGAIAGEQLLKQVGFATASGAAIQLLQSALSGGTMGMSIFGHETLKRAKDEPLSLLGELFLNGLGGPLSMLWWGMQSREAEEGMLFEAGAKMSFPGQLLSELANAAGGYGPYKGKDGLERFGTFLTRNPLGRVTATWSGALGFGDMTPGEKAAVRGFWRWADRVDLPMVRVAGGKSYDDWQEAMTEAAGLIRGGKDATEPLSRAFGLTKDTELSRRERIEKIQSSLRAKRLLPKIPPDRREAMLADLRETIGPDAMAVLERHDAFLDDWARTIRRHVKE